MPHFPDHPTLEFVLYAAAAVVVLFVGYQLGRIVGSLRASRRIGQKEQELFTAQKGFKQLYEQELDALRSQKTSLETQVESLNKRVEDYRKKAAGYGGLFGAGGGKRADAMYALLLENEALEEALYSQNEKLRAERTDSLKEQLRATGYRRVLMSQLLNDDRIKGYVKEILDEEKRLPGPPPDNGKGRPALPVEGEEVRAE